MLIKNSHRENKRISKIKRHLSRTNTSLSHHRLTVNNIEVVREPPLYWK
jgi:hypothetical protein